MVTLEPRYTIALLSVLDASYTTRFSIDAAMEVPNEQSEDARIGLSATLCQFTFAQVQQAARFLSMNFAKCSHLFKLIDTSCSSLPWASASSSSSSCSSLPSASTNALSNFSNDSSNTPVRYESSS